MKHLVLCSVMLALASVGCDKSTTTEPLEGDPKHCLAPGAPETQLQVECRCLDTLDFCKQAVTLPFGTVIGGGATVTSLAEGRVFGGGLNANGTTLLAAVGWKGTERPDEGLVLEVDLVTGNKSVISGQYHGHNEPRTVTGGGPEFGHVRDIVRSIDGQFYVLTHEPSAGGTVSLVQVALDTGNRALVWSSGDAAFGQCDAATVQPWTVVVDASNSFILAADAPGDGSGILRVALDGSTCEWVTRSSGSEAMIGSGVELTAGQYRDIVFNGGDLFAIYDAIPAIVKISSAGERTLLSAADSTYGPIGTGAEGWGAIGERSIAYDWQRGYYWTLGKEGEPTNLVAVSSVDGARVAIPACSTGALPSDGQFGCLAGPISVGTTTANDAVWMHPDQNHLLMIQDKQSFVLYEPVTGNSNVFSY